MRTNPADNQRLAQNRERFPVEHIESMVHRFYGRIRADPMLGPIFESRIDDWPYHLDRMVAFWRAVLRSEPTFAISERGAPPVLHRQIGGLDAAHFERWLTMFGDVVDEIYGREDAIDVMTAARRIAAAFARHIGSALVVAQPDHESR